MNNTIPNQQNQRFSEVREELKRFLSIIMCKVENTNEEGFDYIISNSTNLENIEIAKILKQDELDRENRIKEEQSQKSKKITEKSENKTLSVKQPREKRLSNEQVKKEEKLTNVNIKNNDDELEL